MHHHMADYPTDSTPVGGYSPPMGERIAVLETIAAESRTAIQDLRTEIHDLRADMRIMLQTINDGFAEVRRVHDRDFRMTWGALIAGGLGLMYLLAHTAHRL